MGLFDVNMPMLYGEGSKAFMRLQEEIMKHSNDHSLFAWSDLLAYPDSQCGMLARSPCLFKDSGDVISYGASRYDTPFSMSNLGLQIRLYMSQPVRRSGICKAALNCPVPPHNEGYLGIFLQRLSGSDQYARVRTKELCHLSELGHAETIHVRNSQTVNLYDEVVSPLHVFNVLHLDSPARDYKLVRMIYPPGRDRNSLPSVPPSFPYTDTEFPFGKRAMFKIDKIARSLAGVLLMERDDGNQVLILLGSKTDLTVGFHAIPTSPSIDVEDFSQLQRMFMPQPEGELMLDHHLVSISIDPWTDSSTKYYLLEISIKAKEQSRNPYVKGGVTYGKGGVIREDSLTSKFANFDGTDTSPTTRWKWRKERKSKQ